ncbi:glutamate dehydrogenase [Entamoeba marina]
MADNKIDYSQWLKDHFPSDSFLLKDENVFNTVANLLTYHTLYEEYVFLKGKYYGLVHTLDFPGSDAYILKHYGDKYILSYESIVSNTVFPSYELPLKVCKVSYVEGDVEELKTQKMFELQEAALQSDRLQYVMEKSEKFWNLSFAWKNVDVKDFLYRVASECEMRKIKLETARFSVKDFTSTNTILYGRLVLSGEGMEDETVRTMFIEEFAYLREFVEENVLNKKLVSKGILTNGRAYLLRALATLAEQFLSDKDIALYSLENIYDALTFHANLTKQLIEVFVSKFNPKSTENWESQLSSLIQDINFIDTGRKRHDDRRKNILKFLCTLVKYTLKTNYFCHNKTALGFRLNPEFMNHIPDFDRCSLYPELPFGIFFIYGNSFFGFHVRFRDLARGGLRTVVTRDQEQADYEKLNMFGECYGLSYTQQKKNKDIPEGGAKAIIYLPPNRVAQDIVVIKEKLQVEGISDAKIKETLEEYKSKMGLEYMYTCQRSFVDTLLSLIVTGKDGKVSHDIRDYYGTPEYIYLGPDENMHDCMIEWIAEEAVKSGLHAKGAFISGKEETGINHKEYGVTSLGVFQYLQQGLKHLGINDKYTLKMSGGADGDVGGNMIRLLNKYHKERVSLLAITDKSGTIYDPMGLDLDVLDKFFYEVKAIDQYPAELLHDGGYLLCMMQSRKITDYQKETLCLKKVNGKVVEEWIGANEAVHLFSTNVHKVQADVFCPCGGRPRSLNESNIDTFIVDGKPTSKLICEGANLYLTPNARTALEELGVMIFKDSSANKCGVISSSYEILGGLALDNDQFIDMKKEYASNILQRLESVANAEAVCMLEHMKKTDLKLTEISDLVSLKINEYTDAFYSSFLNIDLFEEKNKSLLQIFIDYVPQALSQKHMKQVLERVPQMHMKAIISTVLATNLVYGKGLSWNVSVVDVLPLILQK